MIEKNKEYRVSVTDLNNLGFGVAKIDGLSVFIADTVTGDEADIRIIKTVKTYAVGTLVRLCVPSPMRCAESEGCPVSRRCGGCVYQRVRYEHERTLKQQYVAYAMKKAGAGYVNVLPVLTTGQITGYRNKAQYPVARDAHGKTVVGFYAAKSHAVIPADSCDLQPPVFAAVAAAVRVYFDGHRLSIYDEKTGKGLLRHIYLRQAKATGELLLCLVINGTSLPDSDAFCTYITERFPAVVSIQYSVNTENTNVVMGKHCTVLWGKPDIEDILCGLRFRIAPLSFYQVNHDGAELLYQKAGELLDLRDGETLLDLYCGIGTIGLSLVAKRKNVRLIGIEIVPEAIENAKENAARNGIKNAAFYCGDASDAEKILSDAQCRADAVVVDPPRKGLTPAVIAYLEKLSPARIVYVSCDPDTLARDIVRFAEVGYHTDTAYPVDMFSRTGHVETVVLMSSSAHPT